MRERRTRAYNTLEIDGENASEVWKSFRVARRAEPLNISIKKIDLNWQELKCGNNAYKRLTHNNIHRRGCQLKNHKLIVKGEITELFESVVTRFNLHPDIKTISITLSLPMGLLFALLEKEESLSVLMQRGILNLEKPFHPNVLKCA